MKHLNLKKAGLASRNIVLNISRFVCLAVVFDFSSFLLLFDISSPIPNSAGGVRGLEVFLASTSRSFIHQTAMDTGVYKANKTLKPKQYKEKLLKTSFVLSVLSILLTLALFARIEILARNTEIKDSKFSQRVQQIQEALDKAAILQDRQKGRTDIVFGR